MNPSPGGTEGKFQPYVPARASLRELTPRALVVGTVLGMVFGASSLYLVLKVGLTVSASIPVAVISLAVFRFWSKFGGRDATILEHNIVQTAGSAGESIAFGVGVTMPAILILGFDLELSRVMLVSILGGLLGILMMIPLRRALIVKEHGKLKFPEGTACAEVLKAGACPESRAVASVAPAKKFSGAVQSRGAQLIFGGFAIGILYNTVMKVFRGWKDTPEKVFDAPIKGGSVAMEITPELLGVGYVIGPRIAAVLMAGGALSYLLLIPLIKFFGDQLAVPLAPENSELIKNMSPGQIRNAYILYIGAGAVAAGGIISLFRSLPTIWHGLRAGLADLTTETTSAGARASRTERDISMKFVVAGIVLLILAIVFATPLHMNALGAVLIVVFGFLFVTVSSRLTGEIGSSSNPISGMTIATLVLTCLIFVVIGWTGGKHYVTALSVGAIVCIAASNGGATSQDLKTGFLVGATPRYQQIAILIGAFASAVVLGPILTKLNEVRTVYVPAATVAPELKADLAELGGEETMRGPQAGEDSKTYRVWHRPDPKGGDSQKFLTDEAGNAVWLVDPGINGRHHTRPDGTTVEKFDAPKATLMSYVIKGILSRKLPWTLVLFGVMIAVVLELCGVSSLAFAVGVYLPIATSAPIFVGGCIRWLVDRRLRARLRHEEMTHEEFVAETDKSPGVMLASGYIAGGAIAGIVIAISEGFLKPTMSRFAEWAKANNPFFAGDNADALALIPFVLLAGFLLLVGRSGTPVAGKTST